MFGAEQCDEILSIAPFWADGVSHQPDFQDKHSGNNSKGYDHLCNVRKNVHHERFTRFPRFWRRFTTCLEPLRDARFRLLFASEFFVHDALADNLLYDHFKAGGVIN